MSTTANRLDRAPFEYIAQAYFTALEDGNLEAVPWSADVLFRGPLVGREPLTGRAQVENFLQPLAGNLGDVQIRKIFVSTSRDAMAVEATVGPLHVLDKFVIHDGQIVEQDNFFDPRPVLNAPARGGLTADERALLIESLEGSRERLRQLLNSVPKEVLEHRPAGGGWTALECAEHLVLSEATLLDLVRNTVLGGAPDCSLPLELQGRDGAVVAAMNDRSHKSQTFDSLVPRGRYASAASVLDSFLARRAETLDFVRSTSEPLHYHSAPLEGLGNMDAYQWLLLIAAHTDRHIEQMREAIQ